MNRHRFIRVIASGWLVAITGCVAAPTGALTPESCVASAAPRSYTVSSNDGHHYLIEPQALASAGQALLVAGSPSYRLTRQSAGYVPDAPPDLFGVIRMPDGRVTELRSPVPSVAMRDVRIAPAGKDEWHLFFLEVDPTSPGDFLEKSVVAVWVGKLRMDGSVSVRRSRWTSRSMPGLSNVSQLVGLGDERAAVAFPTLSGRWSFGVAMVEWGLDGDPVVMQEELRTSYADLAVDAVGHLLLLTVSPDSGRVSGADPLLLSEYDSPTRSLRRRTRLATGGGTAFHLPAFESSRAPQTAVVIRESQVGTREPALIRLHADTASESRIAAPAQGPVDQLAVSSVRSQVGVAVVSALTANRADQGQLFAATFVNGRSAGFLALPLYSNGAFGIAAEGDSVIVAMPVLEGDSTAPPFVTRIASVKVMCQGRAR